MAGNSAAALMAGHGGGALDQLKGRAAAVSRAAGRL